MARNSKTVRIKITADGRAAEAGMEGVKKSADGVDESVKRAESSMERLGDAASDIPGPMGDLAGALNGPAGVAAGVGAAAVGLFAVADNAADAAIEVSQVAKITGTTVEEASKLVAVFNDAGVESTDLQDILLQTSGVLLEDAELAAELGVNLGEGADAASIFQDAVRGLNLKSEFEAGQIGARLFGEEGARQVSGLVDQVGNLDRALDDVDTNRIFSREDTANAQEFKNQTAEIKGALTAVAVEIGQGLIPALSDSLGVAIEIKDTILGWSDSLPISDDTKSVLGDAVWNGVLGNALAVNEQFVELEGSIAASAGQADDLADSVADMPTAGLDEVIEAAGGAELAIRKANTASDDWLRDLSSLESWAAVDRAIDNWAENMDDGSFEAQQAVAEWVSDMDDATAEDWVADFRTAFNENDIERVRALRRELAQEIVTQNRIERYIVNTYVGGAPTPGIDLSGTGSAETGSVRAGNTINITMTGQPSARELDAQIAQWARNG